MATRPKSAKASAAARPVTTKSTKKLSQQEPKIILVKSVAEYLSELDILGYVNSKLWYRGTGHSSYPLTPSLFRHKTARTQSELKKLELDLNETFEMRSLPYSES